VIFRLIYLNGSRKGERITISREPMTIGRNDDCTIALPDDPEAATHHCTIEHSDADELSIRDDGSMNSILINNHETTESKLKHGDTIEIGRTRFLVQAFVQADVPHKTTRTQRKKKPTVAIIIVIVLLTILSVAVYKPLRRAAKASDAEAAKKELIPAVIFKDKQAVEPAPLKATSPLPAPPTTKEPMPPVKTPPKIVKPKPLPLPPPKPVIPPPITIVSLTQQKFPQKPDYDEMRVVSLKLRTTGAVIEDSKVAIRFDFFDRDLTSGEITQARAIVPTKAMQTQGLAATGEEVVTATYTVPKGLRTARAAHSGRAFYGVRAKVMYAGELVAQKAIPTTLLDKD
jgi:pSer/pThr/pTyr-binding forkhead associated (FHA) protein